MRTLFVTLSGLILVPLAGLLTLCRDMFSESMLGGPDMTDSQPPRSESEPTHALSSGPPR